ncbi:MAG TPA: SDR family oxidoreductase [Chitinophagaceae bacterium]|nr:SDR family oxidoreductase [Chitinophagaceae bacterium]
MSLPINQQTIVITGGTSGIGKALVIAYCKLGAEIAVCGRRLETLKELSAELKYDRLLTVCADVSREMDCWNLIDQTIQRFGKIDVLINNAGISMRALFADLNDLSVIRNVMDINFWGTVYCTKYALPFIQKQSGVIVGVSSVAGYRGLPGRTGYSASKFAMQGFLEALRTENLHTGVHVMWVCPGFTSSNIRNTALNAEGNTQQETPLDENKLMSAEMVANAILKAIIHRSRTIVLTRQGKLTVLLSRLFPGMLDNLVYNHFRKEPGSPLK